MELLHQEITGKVIGAAMEVHRTLGCGFLEAIYQEAMEIELSDAHLEFAPRQKLDVYYKGRQLKQYYEPDFLVAGKVIVEIKALSHLSGTEEA